MAIWNKKGGSRSKNSPSHPSPTHRGILELVTCDAPLDACRSVVFNTYGQVCAPQKTMERKISLSGYNGDFREVCARYARLSVTDVIAQWYRKGPSPELQHRFVVRVYDLRGQELWLDSSCDDHWLDSHYRDYAPRINFEVVEALSALEEEILRKWTSWSPLHATPENRDLKGGFLRLVGIHPGSCGYDWYKNAGCQQKQP